jgi:hypothetical protein
MAAKNYIILNPSGNLFKIGALLKEFGLNVYFFNTGELPLIVPNCVHLIFKDVFLTFDRKNSIDQDYNLSMLIKKGLMSEYKLKKMRKELSSIDKSLVNGDVSLLMLYKGSTLFKYNMDIKIEEIDTIKEINPKVEDKIITSTIPYLYLSKYTKFYETLSIYESDFDLVESLGKDYYICFVKNEKIEFYVFNNYLCVIHKNMLDPKALLHDKFPFLQQFTLKRIEYIYFVRNHFPWLENFNSIRTILMNDYSYGGLSIKMIDRWYEGVGRFLCTGMQ